MPQPGDLEGSIGPIAVDQSKPVDVLIDKVVH
jgi:hypothetical protein